MHMSKRQKLAIAAAAVAGAAAVTGAALAAATHFGDKETKTSRITASVDSIVLDASAGDVEVTAIGGPGIEVTTTTRGLLGDPEVKEWLEGSVLHLESTCGSILCGTTDFDVRVPADVAVAVSVDAADVTVSGSPGNLDLETDAGDIDVRLRSAPARIAAEADAGDVDVDVPSGTYAVTVETGAGDELVSGLVRVDRAARTITATTDAGDVTVIGR
jgi:DUF4097 and DUF4098 domain-containing protein YvlB